MKTFLSLLLLALVALVGCSNGATISTTKGSDQDRVLLFGNELRGAVISPPREVEDFTLASTRGEDFTLSDHRGNIILVYFGYMTCPDVCPATMADLLRAYRELDENTAENVVVVFITVDPERDTLDRMDLYTAAFHEDFVGLRGEGEQLEHVMQNFGVQASRREVDSALGYLVDHSASVFVIGSQGKIIEQFLFGTPYQDIAEDIKLLATHTSLN